MSILFYFGLYYYINIKFLYIKKSDLEYILSCLVLLLILFLLLFFVILVFLNCLFFVIENEEKYVS